MTDKTNSYWPEPKSYAKGEPGYQTTYRSEPDTAGMKLAQILTAAAFCALIVAALAGLNPAT